MSSCLSGGAGRTYSIDLDIVKSSSTRTSHSSSPSSTLSDSSNSPITISTRKPRTPRKRPNQTYNEAAALLSTVYPNIFSIKNLTKPFKHSKLQPCNSFSSEECSELLPSFPAFCRDEFLIHQPIPEKPKFRIEYKPVNSSEKACQSPVSSSPCENFEEDFDAESMLDEEMEEGIDSIMGNLCVEADAIDNSDASYYHSHINFNPYYGNSILGFGGKFEFGGVSALRNVDNGDWWRFPTVDVVDISPKLSTATSKSPSEKKKKKKKVEKEEEIVPPPPPPPSKILDSSKEPTDSKSIGDSNLNLKLNYDDVLVAWSDRGSPFSDDISEADAIARLAQIDLFGENGGVREASVLRYREKRRTRLFSKKIRYQVRKVNADRRPRMKGRFVRRPTSMGGGLVVVRDDEEKKKRKKEII